MNKLTLRRKLFIGFGTLLFVLVLSGLVGFRAIVKLDGAADEVARKVTEKELSLLLMEAVFKAECSRNRRAGPAGCRPGILRHASGASRPDKKP